jgi:hypothetical protein
VNLDIAIQKCVFAILFIDWILCLIADILILLIVGAVCIKQAVTVGDKALLTFGKKTENIEDFRVGFDFGKDLQAHC